METRRNFFILLRFNIVFTLVTYVIPMLQMLVSYTHMGIVLWSKEQLHGEGEGSNVSSRRDSYIAQQRERVMISKRKVSRSTFPQISKKRGKKLGAVHDRLRLLLSYSLLL